MKKAAKKAVKVSLTIDLPKKVSTNVFYNLHFHARHHLKQEFYTATLYAARKAKIAPITSFPVDVAYSFNTPGRRLDLTNYSSCVKMIEDGLVRAGVFPSDNQDHISKLTITSKKSLSKGFSVTVTLCPSQDINTQENPSKKSRQPVLAKFSPKRETKR